ncbi:MAG TPA: HIT family protein [Gammaproteobacteria bacterium]
MASEIWDDLASGRAKCPMDYPRPDYNEFVYFVKRLSASSLYLERNQTYRGHCVLICDLGHVTRIDQLSEEQWVAMARDLRAAESAIYRAFRPDHMNVESLGNVMPHLHWHIVPRYKNDGRWGAPIWTTSLVEMPRKTLDESECSALASKIREAMEDAA